MHTRDHRFLWGVIALLVLDRIAKFASVGTWSHSPVEIFSGVRLGFLLNKGFVFSAPSHGIVIVVLSVITLVLFVVWLMVSIQKKNTHDILGISAILAAALSNIFDRVYYGGVVDFLQIGLPLLLNFSDVMILVAVVWLARRKRM